MTELTPEQNDYSINCGVKIIEVPCEYSEVGQEIDAILVKLIQLSYAPIAMEKIANGDVFEAQNEAKQQLLALISDIDRQARYKELNKIARRNYCKDLGTYDFDGLAEDVLDRLSILKEKK